MVGYEYQYDISFGRRRVPVSWFAVRAQLILVADTVASTIGPIVKLSQQTTNMMMMIAAAIAINISNITMKTDSRLI